MQELIKDLAEAFIMQRGIKVKISDVVLFIEYVFDEAHKIDTRIKYNQVLYENTMNYISDLRSFYGSIRSLDGKVDFSQLEIDIDVNLVNKISRGYTLVTSSLWKVGVK